MNKLNRMQLSHFILAVLAVCMTVPTSAQSASEISAAKSMARAYGYSDSEINAVLNHNITGGHSAPATASAPTSTAPAAPATPASAAAVVAPVTEVTVIEAADTPVTDTPAGIYGHSYLTSSGLSIIPSYNAPAPAAYVLGPGDELLVDIWGATVSHVVATIGVDGGISISDLGPVYLSGMTLSKAEEFLKEQLGRIYSGLTGNNPDTFMKLSIGKIKGVSINVSGEVATPGLYSIPSLATIPSVIYMAGGVKDGGSVRNITLFRRGRKVANFDLYDFLFKGKFNENLRIQDGDVINVEAYRNVVSIDGAVARPMRYEIIEGETLKNLIAYANGFNLEAQRTEVHVYRRGVLGNKGMDVPESEFASFRLVNGDRVSVRTYSALDENTVSINGPVKFPGSYAISSSVRDIASLVVAAGGLMEGAYTEKGQIRRLDKDRIPMYFTFNLKDALSGKTKVALEREDEVTLYRKSEFVEQKNVSIEGHVIRPGSYSFTEGMTLADLILQARGVREDTYSNKGQLRRTAADGTPVLLTFNVDNVISGKDNIVLEREDMVRIFSIRELREDATVTIGGEIKNGGIFPYYDGMTLEDLILTGGSVSNGADLRNIQIAHRGGRERGSVEVIDVENNPDMLNLKLAPYDVVSVRRLTYFRAQHTITVNGEVISPGPYSFDEAEIRLSDVMSKVGGFTDAAYLRGASLTRVLTKEEIERQQVAVMIANQNLDQKNTIDLGSLSDRYKIGIDLEKAMSKPGSAADVTLRDGDIIEIPILNNTVKISGGVFYPNSVAFDKNLGWKDYVRQAGGFTKLARKGKTFAVYMNGKVSVGNRIYTEPGMEIVVPERKEEEKHPMSPVEIASIATSTTSLASMVLSLIKMFN